MVSRITMVLLLFSGATSAFLLTPDNYDEATSDKSVFIKFFSPGCGHCKKLAPAWDKLTEEFKNDTRRLIAEVDCSSADGRLLCEANNIRGYPTMKYGNPTSLVNYEGSRDLKDLQNHVKNKLLPSCSPTMMDLCDENQKAEITKFQAMSNEELWKLIDDKDDEMKKVESEFKTGVEQLQKTYESMLQSKEVALEKIKQSGLGLMKAVLIHNEKIAAANKKAEL
jgi:protein disulfide-isomerase-like protein